MVSRMYGAAAANFVLLILRTLLFILLTSQHLTRSDTTTTLDFGFTGTPANVLGGTAPFGDYFSHVFIIGFAGSDLPRPSYRISELSSSCYFSSSGGVSYNQYDVCLFDSNTIGTTPLWCRNSGWSCGGSFFCYVGYYQNPVQAIRQCGVNSGIFPKLQHEMAIAPRFYVAVQLKFRTGYTAGVSFYGQGHYCSADIPYVRRGLVPATDSGITAGFPSLVSESSYYDGHCPYLGVKFIPTPGYVSLSGTSCGTNICKEGFLWNCGGESTLEAEWSYCMYGCDIDDNQHLGTRCLEEFEVGSYCEKDSCVDDTHSAICDVLNENSSPYGMRYSEIQSCTYGCNNGDGLCQYAFEIGSFCEMDRCENNLYHWTCDVESEELVGKETCSFGCSVSDASSGGCFDEFEMGAICDVERVCEDNRTLWGCDLEAEQWVESLDCVFGCRPKTEGGENNNETDRCYEQFELRAHCERDLCGGGEEGEEDEELWQCGSLGSFESILKCQYGCNEEEETESQTCFDKTDIGAICEKSFCSTADQLAVCSSSDDEGSVSGYTDCPFDCFVAEGRCFAEVEIGSSCVDDQLPGNSFSTTKCDPEGTSEWLCVDGQLVGFHVCPDGTICNSDADPETETGGGTSCSKTAISGGGGEWSSEQTASIAATSSVLSVVIVVLAVVGVIQVLCWFRKKDQGSRSDSGPEIQTLGKGEHSKNKKKNVINEQVLSTSISNQQSRRLSMTIRKRSFVPLESGFRRLDFVLDVDDPKKRGIDLVGRRREEDSVFLCEEEIGNVDVNLIEERQTVQMCIEVGETCRVFDFEQGDHAGLTRCLSCLLKLSA